MRKNNSNKPKNVSIISRFGSIFKKYPNKIAIEGKEESVTYREIERRYLTIADFLLLQKKQDIFFIAKPEINSVCAILGALKCGKNCIMPNIHWLDSQLAKIISKSDSKLVLYDDHSISIIKKIIASSNHKFKMINIDDLLRQKQEKQFKMHDDLSLNSSIVLFTSGSAGEPKGVKCSPNNFLFTYEKYGKPVHGYNDKDVFCCIFSSFSFIACVAAIFNSLFSGGLLKLYLSRDNDLFRFLIENKVTRLHFTVSSFRGFFEYLKNYGENNKFPWIRSILVSGDSFYRRDFLTFKKNTNKKCLLAVRYASTEFMNVAARILRHNSKLEKDPIYFEKEKKIEMMIDNNEKAGEIIVSSDFFYSRYWLDSSDKDKLMAKCKPDLGTLFRTGDIGKIIGKNKIIILGRKDSIIKIENQKVSLEELKRVFLTIKEVEDCYARIREDHKCEKFIEMHYSSAEPIKETVLLKYLRKKLGELQIPKKFVHLKKMPLNRNYKINHLKLISE